MELTNNANARGDQARFEGTVTPINRDGSAYARNRASGNQDGDRKARRLAAKDKEGTAYLVAWLEVEGPMRAGKLAWLEWNLPGATQNPVGARPKWKTRLWRWYCLRHKKRFSKANMWKDLEDGHAPGLERRRILAEMFDRPPVFFEEMIGRKLPITPEKVTPGGMVVVRDDWRPINGEWLMAVASDRRIEMCEVPLGHYVEIRGTGRFELQIIGKRMIPDLPFNRGVSFIMDVDQNLGGGVVAGAKAWIDRTALLALGECVLVVPNTGRPYFGLLQAVQADTFTVELPPLNGEIVTLRKAHAVAHGVAYMERSHGSVEKW